ncbi:MAG: hypothetical protein ABIH37_01580 [archaeon]
MTYETQRTDGNEDYSGATDFRGSYDGGACKSGGVSCEGCNKGDYN